MRILEAPAIGEQITMGKLIAMTLMMNLGKYFIDIIEGRCKS